MGKQDEDLRDPEKEWLEVQFKRADVQAKLAGESNSILKDVTRLIYPDYLTVFSGPLEAETEAAFKRRLKNAKKEKKGSMFRRPAEELDEVEERKSKRFNVLKEWFKRRRRREKENGKESAPLPPVPPLTPQRRGRRKGGLDMYIASPAGKKLRATTSSDWAGPGKHRQKLAQAFHDLHPDSQADFDGQARAKNAELLAEELDEAGSSEEILRVLKVPGVRDWFQGIMEHLREEVEWIGGVLVGGPDENGEIKLVNASNGRDAKDRDYFGALAEEIGWNRKVLMTWSLSWFQRAFTGMYDS
ncbi:uncharacterized protein TRAVEDRAFT_45209 [Trametes versicolor FP-101664 SS1]|uniref:uncharacterized protein n=1 Tax=Trametes versicolor (strain FP-101664) TaxID=717944 RepID=UPI0004623516|nr:uncharacterized protein TRAVEDRAFT_45209 [Trametes versicolor FP-101664 SS1]EIW62389.1 hypothetical protein TRAVEDRAFT_45209 [Trametes versicolor FP-101664 SS1]